MNEQPSLLTRCFQTFQRSPALYIAVAFLPYATLHLGIFSLIALFFRSIAGPDANLRAVWLSMTILNKLEFLGLFSLWITLPYALAGRGICRIVSEHIAGRTVTLGRAVYDLLAFFPSALVLAAIASVTGFIGMCFLVLPGFFVAGLFSLVLPAGAVEGIAPFAALRRGIALVWRVAGRVLLLFFFYGAFVLVVMILQGISLAAVPNTISTRAPIYLIWAFVPMGPLALLHICFTLLYYEARAAKPVVPVPSTALGT